VSSLATYEVAGAQDEGTKYIQGLVYIQADQGDGMECQMDPIDSTIFYASSEWGYIDQISTSIGYVSTISTNIPGMPMGAWVTPYIIEPTCHTCLVAGYDDVYRSTDEGTTWTDISGPLTTNNLLRVVTTLADSNTFYAADNGTSTIYYTHNMGLSAWTTLTAPYSGQIISDVIIDPRNAKQIWVAFSGYSSFGSPQIAEYNETTNVWTRYNTNLPDVPVTCLQMDHQNRTMYAGTDIGVYYRDSTMTKWEPFTTGMPVVAVNDLQIDYGTDRIWAATFGRSLWSSGRHTYSVGVPNVVPTTENISVQPNPSQGSFTVIVNNPVSSSPVNLAIMDNLGNIVWRGNSNAATNNTAVRVNTSALAKGVYILQVTGSTGVIGTEKIVID
jgi:hypothetical protein